MIDRLLAQLRPDDSPPVPMIMEPKYDPLVDPLANIDAAARIMERRQQADLYRSWLAWALLDTSERTEP